MDLTITVPAIVAVFMGFIALLINSRNTKTNRNVSAAIQLSKDFYQDHKFNEARLFLWENVISLPDEYLNYDVLVKKVKEDEKINDFEKDDLVALNRTAAFYNSLKGLIETKEVDVKLLREFFGYNYNKFWEPLRSKIVQHTDSEISRSLFRKIPELEIS